MTAAGTVRAGQGARARRRRRRAAGDRHGPPAGRRRLGVRHAAGGARSRCESLGATFVELRAGRRGGRRTPAATPRELSEAQYAQQQELVERTRGRLRRRHHHGPDPGPAGAAADHRGRRRGHAAGLGDRRPGRRGRRQLRADGARRGRRCATASPSSARSTCPPPCRCTPARCTPATSPACSSLIIADGELTLDFEDEIMADACVTHEGRIVSRRLPGGVQHERELVLHRAARCSCWPRSSASR